MFSNMKRKSQTQCFLMNLAILKHKIMEDDERNILLENKILIFSSVRMTWNEGEVYCRKKSGRIASILNTKTLSAVLAKMTELGNK